MQSSGQQFNSQSISRVMTLKQEARVPLAVNGIDGQTKLDNIGIMAMEQYHENGLKRPPTFH